MVVGAIRQIQIETKRSQLIGVIFWSVELFRFSTLLRVAWHSFCPYVHTHNFPSSKPAKSKLPTSHTEVILKLENALSECKTWSPVCLASTTLTKPLEVARKIPFSSEEKEKEVMASFRETSREEMRAPLVE